LKICNAGKRAGKLDFLFITNLVKTYPKEEKYSLVDNMKRAARSTTQKIAEGFGRFHYKENVQFCRISRKSLFEHLDDLITSLDDGYISKEKYEKVREKLSNALAFLNKYISYLNRQSHLEGQSNNQ
jgi:four helix bundle protein